MKIAVAYDGTLQAKEALKVGMVTAKETGAEFAVLGVFDDGFFVDYGAGPSAIDRARAEFTARLEEAKAIIMGSGLRADIYTAEGDPDEAVADFARSHGADVLFAPRRFASLGRRLGVPDTGCVDGSPVSAKGCPISVLGIKAA